MNNPPCGDVKFPTITPATTLLEVWKVFEPTLVVDPTSEFYVTRTDPKLQKLNFDLRQSETDLHVFLCGHRGSGKTTELNRLCLDRELLDKYRALFLSAQDFGSEVVHLTHDALMVEIGLALAKQDEVPDAYADELNDWGKEVVTSFVHDQSIKAEVGARANAWLAFFRAQLGSRREWQREERLKLEPRIQDLIGILNRMAQELRNKTGKKLLVVIDDLEKGESDAHKEMHGRLFEQSYETLVKPRFSIIYTLPIWFRSLAGSRIPRDELYDFSAIHLYERQHKTATCPPLEKDQEGYRLLRDFVEKRLQNPSAVFGDGVLDELLRIGGGLFRETARAIHEAAYFAMSRHSDRIGMEDAEKVFSQIKKEYQPMIRGADVVKLLKDVLESEQGWVPGVEPYLQSRAVVEYENGDLWLDLRYVLKEYVRGMKSGPA